jgi:methionine biosynthesis protein MetW
MSVEGGATKGEFETSVNSPSPSLNKRGEKDTAEKVSDGPVLIKPDYKVILDIIEPFTRVLDLGCGDGELMKYLETNKQAKVQGIELSEEAIYKCVEKGLSVFHTDIDSGLSSYPDASFDYVILNQSLQQVKKIDFVIDEALRVGAKAIVGFPNFANLEARFMLFFGGKAPVTENLPYEWHNTPNIRSLSIKDFKAFCAQKNIKILANYNLGPNGYINFWPNLLAENSIFVISR